MKNSKLKIRDILWLIYELLIFPGYGILGWLIMLEYIIVPYDCVLAVVWILFLFYLPNAIMSGMFGEKWQKKLAALLKITI